MNILDFLSNHIVSAILLGGLLLLTLALGLLHELWLFGELSLVVVRFLKHSVGGIRDVGRRLKKELTTWEGDP